MLAVISPAKTLDFETPSTTTRFTQPDLLEHSAELIRRCRALAPQDIASLMKVSDKIAALNFARFADWHTPFTPDNAKQALLAFKGDVYTGLAAETLSEAELDYAQDHLRLLSGLYGVLRPLDLMQAYRLEMGARLGNPRGKDLYQFWDGIITDQLNQALAAQGDNILVNLASNEYFKSVKPGKLDAEVITPVFKDAKNGQYKVISFFAKKARGAMARYLIENRLSHPEQLNAFDWEGYRYNAALSQSHGPVFTREAT